MKFNKIKLKDTIISANTGADAIQRAPIVDYDTGKKCLRIGDISNHREYNEWGFTNVNDENYKKYKLEKNDILIARTGGTIGINRFIDRDLDAVYNNGLIRLKINKEKYNSRYIYYTLQTSKFKSFIESIAFGTTGQPNMKINDLLTFKIIDIPIERQNKLVDIISKLDKKIDNNMYEIGDNLYKKYYLQYINELPEGYEIKLLNEVADNYDAKRKPMSSREREFHKGIYPYYGATSIIDYVDNYIFDDIYVLMGEDGTVKTDKGNPVLQYIWGKNWINNHAHVLKGTQISTEHLYFALRNVNVVTLITGAVQPKINQENMNKIKLIIGPDEINSEFERIIANIMQKSKLLIEENKILGKLRDALLPKLMKGEIDS